MQLMIVTLRRRTSNGLLSDVLLLHIISVKVLMKSSISLYQDAGIAISYPEVLLQLFSPLPADGLLMVWGFHVLN